MSADNPTSSQVHPDMALSPTPATANKAAEEGGLPVKPWEDRMQESGKRECESLAIDCMLAEIDEHRDRASRQVANKAEVEPDTQAHAIFPPKFPAFSAHGLEGNMQPDELWDYACLVGYRCATPPATTGASTAKSIDTPVFTDVLHRFLEDGDDATLIRFIDRYFAVSVGASTVLTDERKPLGYARFRAAQRITTDGDVDANEWYEFCEPHDIGDDKLPAFPVYDEPVREVAAQAGQVAVPEVVVEALDIALDLAMAEADNVHRAYAGYKPHKHEAVDRDVETVKRAIDAVAAPSPAKESK